MKRTGPQPAENDVYFRCIRCQRATAVTTSEALRYLREGWPVCCGGLMFYSAPPTHPTPGPGPEANETEPSSLESGGRWQ